MKCTYPRIVRAALAVLFLSLALAHANAADDPVQKLLACADEPDDARRLRCFDAAAAGARSVKVAPAAVVPVATPEEKFGARGDVRKEQVEELTEIAATATAVSKRPHGEHVITLDNGQVWAEIAPSKIRVKEGDPVKIEAGILGSFLLIAPNGRASKVSRIR